MLSSRIIYKCLATLVVILLSPMCTISVALGPNFETWDTSDNLTSFIGDNLIFYLRLSNHSNITHLVCMISFDRLDYFNMTINDSAGLFWYERTFSETRSYNYEMRCNNEQGENNTVNGTAVVHQNTKILTENIAGTMQDTHLTIMAQDDSEPLNNFSYCNYSILGDNFYNLLIDAQTSNGSISVLILNLSFQNTSSLRYQLIENYTGSKPSAIQDISSVFYINDSEISFSNAEVKLPKMNHFPESILHCTAWDYINISCNNWDIRDSGEYNLQENSSHFWFNVTSFDAFGGGAGNTLPNLTNITIYDITGLGIYDRSNVTEFGINTTFDLKSGRRYRIEFNILNTGISWNIDVNDSIYHEGIDINWSVNPSQEIWYTDADSLNYTGGNFSNGKIEWNLSLGGQIKSGEAALFNYVISIDTNDSAQYPVFFKVNDTSKSSGSYDYSGFNIEGRYPDMLVYDIRLNNSNPVENDSVAVYANITNIGDADASEVLVRFWETTTQTSLRNLTVTLAAGTYQNLNVTWIAGMGLSTILVEVDPPIEENGSIQEWIESNNYISKSVWISSWQVYYGNISGEIGIYDKDKLSLMRWQDTLRGNIYIADKDSNISWDSLVPVGQKTDTAPSIEDFNEIDSALSMNGFNDSVNAMFTKFGDIIDEDWFSIFGENISGIPICNSTTFSPFKSGLLWDSSDSLDNTYDDLDREDIILVTKIHDNWVGSYGTYDYEIRVPKRLASYKGASNMVIFYGELR